MVFCGLLLLCFTILVIGESPTLLPIRLHLRSQAFFGKPRQKLSCFTLNVRPTDVVTYVFSRRYYTQ